MLAAISKGVILYLSPLLCLTSLLLTLFTFLAPVIMLQSQVSLMAVIPSNALTSGEDSAIDGPTVLMGILGACSRPKNDADLSCAIPSITPTYDLSTLPSDAPQHLLSSPTSGTPAFIAVALGFQFFFFITFTLISFRSKLGAKMDASLDKPMIQRISAWIGFLGFIIGLTAFLVVRMWFGKAAQDFNSSIAFSVSHDDGAPDLKVELGNGWIMIWVAFAFYAAPLIVSMSKMNATFNKA